MDKYSNSVWVINITMDINGNNRSSKRKKRKKEKREKRNKMNNKELLKIIEEINLELVDVYYKLKSLLEKINDNNKEKTTRNNI